MVNYRRKTLGVVTVIKSSLLYSHMHGLSLGISVQRVLLVMTQYFEHDWLCPDVVNERLRDRYTEL